MARKATQRPTDSELSILRVLWQLGPSTVRRVHEELSRHETTGYTTVLKILQIMTDKGLVERDASSRAHVYKPLHSQEHTQRRLVGDLLDRAFGGSASRLLVQALAARPAGPQERQEIRRLLESFDEQTDDPETSPGDSDNRATSDAPGDGHV